MRSDTPHLRRFGRAVARRMWMRQSGRIFQRIMYPACLVSLLLLVMRPVADIGGARMIPVILLVGFIIAITISVWRRPTQMQALSEADQRLGTGDLFSTALQQRSDDADPWAAAVVAQAHERVRTSRPDAVVPYPVPARATLGWVLLTALVGVWVTLIHPAATPPDTSKRLAGLQSIPRPSLPANHVSNGSDPNDVTVNFSDAQKNVSEATGRNDDHPLGAQLPHAQPSGVAGEGTRQAATHPPTVHQPPIMDANPARVDSQRSSADGHNGIGSGIARTADGAGSPGGGITSDIRQGAAAPQWPGGKVTKEMESGPVRMDWDTIPASYRDLVREFFNRQPPEPSAPARHAVSDIP